VMAISEDTPRGGLVGLSPDLSLPVARVGVG